MNIIRNALLENEIIYDKMDYETECPHCKSIFQFNIDEAKMRINEDTNIEEYYVKCPVCNKYLYENIYNVKFKKL